MLKFFRGEWCPFCQAELKRFDAMEEGLNRYKVRVIALSKDTPEAAQAHQLRDSLRLTLLCDPELAVIRSYGMEHCKALEFSEGKRLAFLGMFVWTRPSFRHMAASTTLLVDEHGIIRWIDQTDDYKIRSSSERVMAAIEHVFGSQALTRRAARDAMVVRAEIEMCDDCRR